MSVTVTPGARYYWHDSDDRRADVRHDALIEWLELNVAPGGYRRENHFAPEIKFVFEDEADAIAFKLRFGI